MTKPKMTYVLEVRNYIPGSGPNGSKSVHETRFQTKAQGRRAFLSAVPAHLSDPDMVVTLIAAADDDSGIVLACKYRRENTAQLHAGFFA